MPSDTLLPRRPIDPENLRRLRDAAMERLREEETEERGVPGLVSRRRALLGVAAGVAAMSPVVRAAGSFRATAPQYGAPGLYGAAPLPEPSAFRTRHQLDDATQWLKSRTYVVPKLARDQMAWGNNTDVRKITYELAPQRLVGLSVVAENGVSFVVDSHEVFYVPWKGDLWGFHFGEASLLATPSLFHMATPADGIGDVVAAFAARFDDAALIRATAPKKAITIPLTEGVPFTFWGGKDSNHVGYPNLYNLGLDGDLLVLSANAPGTGNGTFTISMASMKLIKFEGPPLQVPNR